MNQKQKGSDLLNRDQILLKIDELQARYEISNNKEKPRIDKEIHDLGKQLTSQRRKNKIEQLRKKGERLSFSEVSWLRDQGITKIEMRKILKLSFYDYEMYIKNHEEGGNTMSAAKGDVKEAKRLLEETDMAIVDIARKTGVKDHTAYYHANKIRGNQKKSPVKIEPTLTAAVPQEKYNQLKNNYDLLKQQYSNEEKEWKRILAEKEELISDLNSDITNKQPAENHDWKTEYLQQKAAHNQLFKYVSLIKGE